MIFWHFDDADAVVSQGYCCCQVHVTADGLESGPILGSSAQWDGEMEHQGISPKRKSGFY